MQKGDGREEEEEVDGDDSRSELGGEGDANRGGNAGGVYEEGSNGNGSAEDDANALLDEGGVGGKRRRRVLASGGLDGKGGSESDLQGRGHREGRRLLAGFSLGLGSKEGPRKDYTEQVNKCAICCSCVSALLSTVCVCVYVYLHACSMRAILSVWAGSAIVFK